MKGKIKGKKRTILAVSLVGLLAIVGGTIAYHATTGSLSNVFNVASWEVQGVETFDSPSGWTPCDETPKVVIARNTGNTPAAVRIKYSEYWRLPNSAVTDPDDHTTTELPLIDGDNNVVGIVNLDNVNDWELKSDGYYYYKKLLMPGQDSSSFMRSVTLNCNINFGGTNNTCTTVGNATTCTNPNSPYESSTFHVYVTIEFADDASTWPVTPQRMKVYDYVASLTQGLDTNIDFDSHGYDYSGETNGVYTLNTHASDTYPVYYYRGNITDNYVVFGDYCWLLMRTTDTGGTKMLYAGPVTNGQCINNTSSYERSAIIHDEMNYREYYGVSWDARERFGLAGYMFGNYSMKKRVVNSSNPYVIISDNDDYSWSSNGYSFSSSIHTNDWHNFGTHKYFIPDMNDTKKMGYVLKVDRSDVYYIEVANGDTVENMQAHYFDNAQDSNVKRVLEKWYKNNLINLTDKLEDTIYCNDRSVSGHNYEEEIWTSANFYYETDAYNRLMNGHPSPTVDCARKNDSFTVNETVTSNGKLTYPVGLPTADELTLANSGKWIKSPDRYEGTWTMTAARINGSGDSQVYYFDNMFEPTTAGNTGLVDIRPVVSLKNATYIGGGIGTYSNPFKLEW